jgi:hypothetical protein
MFKLISHLLVFVAGAAVGVYWGVHNPTAAANISDAEQARINQAVALAKQNVLQKVVADQSATPPAGQPAMASHLSQYQQMLDQTNKEYEAAKAKLNGQ